MKKAFRKFIKSLNNEEDVLQNVSEEHTYTPNKHMKLHYAVLSEQESNIRKYSSKYANNTDALNRTPLHLAVLQGNENHVNILLENGANAGIADNEGYTPFLR